LLFGYRDQGLGRFASGFASSINVLREVEGDIKSGRPGEMP
jgi:hypothetical protein